MDVRVLGSGEVSNLFVHLLPDPKTGANIIDQAVAAGMSAHVCPLTALVGPVCEGWVICILSHEHQPSRSARTRTWAGKAQVKAIRNARTCSMATWTNANKVV